MNVAPPGDGNSAAAASPPGNVAIGESGLAAGRPETPRANRGRLRWAWTVLAIGVIGVGGFAVSHSEFLDVDDVQITGLSTEAGTGLSKPELIEAAAVMIGSPMLTVDIDGIAERLIALPWVAEVTVSRRWPSSVELWIRQRVAVANAVDRSASVALLDAEGTVLEHRGEQVVGIPVIRVDQLGRPGTRMTGLAPLLLAVEALTPELFPWVVALVPTADGVIAELVGGVEAFLGFGQDYHDEFRSLEAVLRRVELACIVEVDVSLHSSPVVRRDDLRCG